MKNSKQTMVMAQDLKAHMAAAGHELSTRDAWMLARVAQVAAGRVEAELAGKAREERVRKGMVARAVMDLRACGAWDGE